MRFFIVFLVFALSLAASASVPDIKKAFKYMSRLQMETDTLLKVSNGYNLCGPSSNQSCKASKRYLIERENLLYCIKDFSRLADKTLNGVQDELPLTRIITIVSNLRYLSSAFSFSAKSLFLKLPQEITLEKKNELETSISRVNECFHVLTEYSYALFKLLKEENQSTSGAKPLNNGV